ncbi:Histone-lysine N-methyltransferase SETMAR, partial [Habropoda laboriosa]
VCDNNGKILCLSAGRIENSYKEEKERKMEQGVLLLHDKAAVPKGKVVMAAVIKCGFQTLNHPPYSPDLTPSYFYLFPNLKKVLHGKKFEDDEEVKSAITDHF